MKNKTFYVWAYVLQNLIRKEDWKSFTEAQLRYAQIGHIYYYFSLSTYSTTIY